MADEMADVPDDTTDVFTHHLDGVFGRFETGTSYELYYLLTAVRLVELDRLETAREAFPISDVDFEELIQRDIDYSRVDNDLVAQYLKANVEGARFFPPLLVSVVPTDTSGGMQERYSRIDTKTPDKGAPAGKLVRTWDVDKFQLTLHTRSTPTGHVINVNKASFNYIPHAARLRYNPEAVKMVVIDGQHRFEALRTVYRNDKSALGNTVVPVCIVFSANATEASNPSEDIRRDFRELFVTINSKAKEVSGHFLVLLADQSLSAHAIRAIANKWKRETPSLLPLLEWNTREAGKAFQLQRPFAITTVSILADALKKYAFKNASTTEVILNLRAVADLLEKDPEAPKARSIKEDVFAYSQVEALKGQVDAELRPALETLFLTPTPYADLKSVFLSSVGWLNERVAEKTPGAEQYYEVLYGSRQIRPFDLPSLRDFASEFEKRFTRDGAGINQTKPYFLNVFQQGLVRAWVQTATALGEGQANKSAKALVAALGLLCFQTKEAFFAASQPYMQNALYRGERVIVSEIAKSQWANLILATLLYKNAIDLFIEGSGVDKRKQKKLTERIRKQAEQSLVSYLSFLRAKTRDFVTTNWRYMDLEAATHAYLIDRADSEDPDEQNEFREKLDELVEVRTGRGQEVLLNRLGLETKTVEKWMALANDVDEGD